MKKKFIVILWTSGLIGLLIIGFLETMNYATDYMLRSIITSSQVDSNLSNAIEISNQQLKNPSSSPIHTSDLDINSMNSINSPKSIQSEVGIVNLVSPTPDINGSVAEAKGESTKTMPANSVYDHTQPVSIPSSPTLDNKGYDGNISVDKAEQVQDQITLKDKAKVSSVLLKKLSSSDISLFVKMSGDGVTVEEKKQAKKVILEKLTEAEYNELIAIAAKLGLSSGRGYQETQKDYETK